MIESVVLVICLFGNEGCSPALKSLYKQRGYEEQVHQLQQRHETLNAFLTAGVTVIGMQQGKKAVVSLGNGFYAETSKTRGMLGYKWDF